MSEHNTLTHTHLFQRTCSHTCVCRLDDLSSCDNPAQPAASSQDEGEGREAEEELQRERYAYLDYGKEHQLAHPLGRPPAAGSGDSSSSASDDEASGSEGGWLCAVICKTSCSVIRVRARVVTHECALVHVFNTLTTHTQTQGAQQPRSVAQGLSACFSTDRSPFSQAGRRTHRSLLACGPLRVSRCR